MKEIEVKFCVSNFSSVREKIKNLGAHMVWKGTEENIFFDTRRRDLYKKQTLFRLRHWNNHSVTVTVKTTPENRSMKYKIKHEYEIEVGDFAAAEYLIEALGFVKDFAYKKYREHWKLGKAFVELDSIGALRFVEIEASKKDINTIAHTVGLDWKKVERRGYIKILKDMRKRKKN